MTSEYGLPARRWIRSKIDSQGRQLWYSVQRTTKSNLQLSDLETLRQELMALSHVRREELLSNM